MSEKQLNNQLVVTTDAKLFGKLGDEFGEFDVSAVPTLGVGGRLRNIIYMTASGTYSKPVWLKFVIIKGVAGGGAGGGIAATVAGQNSIGGGGQAGGYFEKRILASALAESETVTIGAGGTPGAAGANTGGAGETTSFGTHCSATGGTGGNGGAAYTNTASTATGAGTSGGQATGGDLNVRGEPGGRASVAAGTISLSGYGGAAYLSSSTAYGNNSDGNTGAMYGGGGSSTYNGVSQPARAGGPGAPGIVIIEEYE